jgi:hypothetical protein
MESLKKDNLTEKELKQLEVKKKLEQKTKYLESKKIVNK